MLLIIAFGLALSIIVGVAANTRGRSGFGWFLLSLIISPILAGLLVLALPRRDREVGGDYYRVGDGLVWRDQRTKKRSLAAFLILLLIVFGALAQMPKPQPQMPTPQPARAEEGQYFVGREMTGIAKGVGQNSPRPLSTEAKQQPRRERPSGSQTLKPKGDPSSRSSTAF
jgi:hypothetical protein